MTRFLILVLYLVKNELHLHKIVKLQNFNLLGNYLSSFPQVSVKILTILQVGLNPELIRRWLPQNSEKKKLSIAHGE